MYLHLPSHSTLVIYIWLSVKPDNKSKVIKPDYLMSEVKLCCLTDQPTGDIVDQSQTRKVCLLTIPQIPLSLLNQFWAVFMVWTLETLCTCRPCRVRWHYKNHSKNTQLLKGNAMDSSRRSPGVNESQKMGVAVFLIRQGNIIKISKEPYFHETDLKK